MSSKFFSLVLTFLFLAIIANGQDIPTNTPVPVANTDPSSILNKVLSKYKSMDTYSSTGTIVCDLDTGGKVQMTTTFSIKMKKPNNFLITWSQVGMMPGGMPQAGAAWSDGTQSYLYMGALNSYSKVSDCTSALAGATGISGGAAYTIPSLFLPAFMDKGSGFQRLKNLEIEKSEAIGGEDCYVISGSSDVSKKETIWISKSRSLILKYERSLASPAGGRVIPDLSDADLEKAIRAMGQTVTDESKKQMRDMMQNAKNTLKNSDMSGLSTETHVDISSPNLTENDFHFAPPSGTTLKDSLFSPQSGFTKPVQLPNGSSSYETVQAPVVKVFSAMNGTNKFVAYLVKWKDFDVIVSDPLARSDFKVGDSISFLAQKIDGDKYSSLSFTLLSH